MRHAIGMRWGAYLGAAAAILVVPPAFAQAPIEIVEDWIAQSERFEWLEITHAGITHDAASGTTTVKDLEISIELSDLPGATTDGKADSVDLSYIFAFPSLVFERLDVDGAYYVADRIQAEELLIDFQIDSESQGSSSTTGSYDGLAAANLRWARLPDIAEDPARPVSRFYPLAAALVDVSFESMEFGVLDLVSETSDPPMTTAIQYGAGTVGSTERGNISTMTMDGIWLSASAREAEEADHGVAVDYEMEIGSIAVRQYNYGDMVRLFDPSIEPGAGGDAFETMNGWFSAADWTIATEGVEITIEELRMEDLGGRRPPLPVLSRADALYLAIENDQEPDPIELVELVAATYGAFRLGLMEATGLAFEADEFGGSLAATGVAGLSSDGIETIYYRGLQAGDDAGDVEIALGDFTISDLGFPSLAALLALEQAQESGDIDTMLRAVPTLGGLSLGGLVLHVPFVAELSLARAHITMADHIGPIPTRIATLIDDLRMPTWMIDDEEALETFEALGYDEIAASHELSLTWEEAGETIALSSSTTLEDGGTLGLDATFGGIPRGALENPMSLMFVAFGITLNEASAVFTDASLTDRVLSMLAQDQGTDIETMRAQAAGILPFVLAALQRPDFLTMVTAAAGAFLEDPGTLRIEMRPDEPVPMMQLMEAADSDPGRVVDMLNVEVSSH